MIISPRWMLIPLLCGALVIAACDKTPQSDTRVEHLEMYIKAWNTADSEMAHNVLDDSFVLHDPDYGDIPKAEFKNYFSVLKSKISQIGGAQPGKPYLVASDISYREEGQILVAWVHWVFPPTPIEGASLFRIGPSGLLSEQLFNKAPFGGASKDKPENH